MAQAKRKCGGSGQKKKRRPRPSLQRVSNVVATSEVTSGSTAVTISVVTAEHEPVTKNRPPPQKILSRGRGVKKILTPYVQAVSL
jgi:hypothetical protein